MIRLKKVRPHASRRKSFSVLTTASPLGTQAYLLKQLSETFMLANGLKVVPNQKVKLNDKSSQGCVRKARQRSIREGKHEETVWESGPNYTVRTAGSKVNHSIKGPGHQLRGIPNTYSRLFQQRRPPKYWTLSERTLEANYSL